MNNSFIGLIYFALILGVLVGGYAIFVTIMCSRLKKQISSQDAVILELKLLLEKSKNEIETKNLSDNDLADSLGKLLNR